MKLWLSLTTIPETDQYLELAREAEALGFHGLTLADHLVFPTQYESKYPYTSDGEFWIPSDTPWPDPWITMTAMAAVTKTLQFATNIYLAALRDPFTVARSVGTAAVLSNNRMTCGVSVGWLKEEYDIVGIDFTTRGRRMDELLAVVRRLLTGQEVNYQGEFFTIRNAIMHPAPSRPVKIWSGGAAKAALRRAASQDGWLGLPLSRETAKPLCDQLLAFRREMKKPVEGFDIAIASLEPYSEEVLHDYRDMGVTQLMVMPPWMPSPWGESSYLDKGDDIRELAVKVKALRRFAENVPGRFS